MAASRWYSFGHRTCTHSPVLPFCLVDLCKQGVGAVRRIDRFSRQDGLNQQNQL
jgi:hypothetical protein